MNMLISLLRPQSRQAAARTLPRLSTAAVTVLGIGFTRNQILHISLLLFLRSIISSIPLPIESSVSTYMWSLLFSSAQASIALAATANLLDWGGILGRLSTHFLLRGSTPFLKLYSILVMIAGPAAILIEPVIVAFEVMALSRTLEHKMFSWEARGGGNGFRAVILFCMTCIVGGMYFLQDWIRTKSAATATVVSGTGVMIIITSCIVTSANIIEGTCLALYTVISGVVAIIENFKENQQSIIEHSVEHQETRAGCLVYSIIMLFILLMRGPRFLRVALNSHDAVKAEELQSTQVRVGETEQQSTTTDAETMNAIDSKGRTFAQGMLSAFAVLAVTFRVLLWGKQIEPGEYLPLATRWAQAFATFGFYVMLLLVP